MKLLVMLSIDGHAQALHRLLADHQVAVFSETEVDGYHQDATESPSWFGHGHPPTFSRMALAFIDAARADDVLAAIEAFNASAAAERPVHAYMLAVERAV